MIHGSASAVTDRQAHHERAQDALEVGADLGHDETCPADDALHLGGHARADLDDQASAGPKQG